jgi:hypothetical protein
LQLNQTTIIKTYSWYDTISSILYNNIKKLKFGLNDQTHWWERWYLPVFEQNLCSSTP